MSKSRSEMQESLTIRLSRIYLDGMDKMLSKGIYGTKSEIVRESLRMFFAKWNIKLLLNQESEDSV